MIIQTEGKFTVAIFVITAFVLALSVASATIIYVPEGGNQTIQQAVDNATAGDTIIVRDGTYTENVNVTKRLTIHSQNGSANCIVAANDTNDHVFNVTADWVNITEFTVTGAAGLNKAGIYLSSVAHCNISNNNASNNYFYGIFLDDSSNNTLTNNTASNNSFYGIYVYDHSSSNNLTGNTALHNWEGISVLGSSYNNLTDNNASYNNGYGIELGGTEGGYHTLTGNTVISTYFYQGIFVSSSNNLIYNNYFDNFDRNAQDFVNNIWNISKTPGKNIIGGPYLGGNYWSDYGGTDTDGDGLGNTPYSILGDSNQDNLPLVLVSGGCGDICVNTAGWWRDGGDFNLSDTPIQAAVDNATAGETICVHSGTYHENVVVNVDNLTIRSENGSANCIIAANDTNDHVFNVTADWVNITGFTVRNATGDEMAGIWLDGVEHCNISDNNATNNTCGIGLSSSSNNTLINNIASSNGVGIVLNSSHYNNLTDNNASLNDWHGIVLDGSAFNNLTGNTANLNEDIGIYLLQSNYNNLTSNTANLNYNIGIYLLQSNYSNLTSNSVNANSDGIYLANSNNNTLLNNIVAGHKDLGDGSFDILVDTDGEWAYRGEFGFYNYEARELPIGHDAGNLTLRLTQHGHDAAYVDYVAVKKGDTVYTPATAVNLGTGANVRYKILDSDYDVCDAWESTLELRWENMPADTTLIMRAMEEDLVPGHGSPLYYPLLREGRTLSCTLVNDGGITVDGSLNEAGEPDFSVFWRPDSPHPDGHTYGWLHADDQYVYAAVEVTADNTPDDEDWGALFIMVNDELQKFCVAPAETTWGQIGFQYTSSVPYEHRVYEFKIPLSAIDAQIGDEIHYGFGAYGTVESFYAGIVLCNYDNAAFNNTLLGNIVTDNDYGVYVRGSSNNTITCNLVYKNIKAGFFLTAPGSANSTGNNIENNNIMANGKYNSTSKGWEWNFWNQQTVDVNATDNYWGTAVSLEIAASINEDTGNVTYESFLNEPAPCAPLVEITVNKTVWDPVTEEWVSSRLAMINETLRFQCTIQNTGTLNLTQLRFWDIFDCSLEYAGNATMTIPSLGIEDQPIDLEITPRYQQPYNHTFKQRVLHPMDYSWDPYGLYSYCQYPEYYDSEAKVCNFSFYEICPEAGKPHYLHGWDDTDNNGRVSTCDQLWLESYEEWYHVDYVPYTLLVNDTETGESMYLDSVLDYEAINRSDPNSTEWTEVCWVEACCGKDIYTLENWTDNSSYWDHDFSASDTIMLRNERTGNVTEYTVTELAIDLVVSMEWEVDHLINNSMISQPLSQRPPVGALVPEDDLNTFIVTGPPSPENSSVLEPGQSITIAYDATVIRCGGLDNNTFRAKGNPEYMPPDMWHYSNEDKVTITVPCVVPSGEATDPGGFAKEVYTLGEPVYAVGSGFEANKNVSIYIIPFQQLVGGENLETLKIVGPVNVTTDGNGDIGPVLIWPDPVPGHYLMVFDDPNGEYDPGTDPSDEFSVTGAAVPLVTPLGILALMGLLSFIAISTIVRRKKR